MVLIRQFAPERGKFCLTGRVDWGIMAERVGKVQDNIGVWRSW